MLVAAVLQAPLLYGAGTERAVHYLLALIALSLIAAPSPVTSNARLATLAVLGGFGAWVLVSAFQMFGTWPKGEAIPLLVEGRRVLGLLPPAQPLNLNPSRFPDALARGSLVAATLLAALLHGQDRNFAFRFLALSAVGSFLTATASMMLHVAHPGYVLWQPKVAYIKEFTGTFVNRGAAGAWQCLGALIALVLLARTIARLSQTEGVDIRGSIGDALCGAVERPATVGFFSLAFLILSIGLLLTGSRASLLLYVAALVVFVMLLVVLRGAPRWLLILSATLVIGAALSIFSFAGRKMMERITDRGLFEAGRWEIWHSTLAGIAERPLTGFGLGAFRDAFPLFRSPALAELGLIRSAHSLPLEIALETGLPVALLLSAIWLFLCAQLAYPLLAFRRFDAVRIAGLLAALTAIGFVSIDVSSSTFGYVVPMLAIVGVGVGQPRLRPGTGEVPADDDTAGID